MIRHKEEMTMNDTSLSNRIDCFIFIVFEQLDRIFKFSTYSPTTQWVEHRTDVKGVPDHYK